MNLVEIGNDAVKEDDRAVLLEGGGLQSASPKARSSTSSLSPILKFVIRAVDFFFLSFLSILVDQLLHFYALFLLRFLMMDETFLVENQLTLRAM